MPRRLLKKICPSPGSLQKHWYLRPFGDRIADPRLWTLHRRAVTSAFGVGLAICFIPLPVHLLVAGIIAIALRINLPAIYGTTLGALIVESLECPRLSAGLPGCGGDFHYFLGAPSAS